MQDAMRIQHRTPQRFSPSTTHTERARSIRVMTHHTVRPSALCVRNGGGKSLWRPVMDAHLCSKPGSRVGGGNRFSPSTTHRSRSVYPCDESLHMATCLARRAAFFRVACAEVGTRTRACSKFTQSTHAHRHTDSQSISMCANKWKLISVKELLKKIKKKNLAISFHFQKNFLQPKRVNISCPHRPQVNFATYLI